MSYGSSRQKANLWLWSEFSILFLITPAILYFYASPWNVPLVLWLFSIYALLLLGRDKEFSWQKLWRGEGWPRQKKWLAVARFLITAPLIIGLTLVIAPGRLFSFPLERPMVWLIVMVLYPILSVIPQEFMFRSFFFRRYRSLFFNEWLLIAVSAFSFGFVHIVFHNWMSPILAGIGGLFFSLSYRIHHSLKWAVVEHSFYGCMIFTAGIGFYFLVGGFRP